jgi:hypothetical protein
MFLIADGNMNSVPINATRKFQPTLPLLDRTCARDAVGVKTNRYTLGAPTWSADFQVGVVVGCGAAATLKKEKQGGYAASLSSRPESRRSMYVALHVRSRLALKKCPPKNDFPCHPNGFPTRRRRTPPVAVRFILTTEKSCKSCQEMLCHD